MRSETKLANDSWESLLQAHALLMKRFLTDDDWSRVSMKEYDVLYTLAKQDRPIRIGELHDRVLLSQPGLSRMVDRMVDAGLISREPDPADGRGVLLSLTSDGRNAQRQMGRRHARTVAKAMGERLRSEQLLELERLCLELAGVDT